MKVRAVYSATLKAHKLLENTEDSYENKLTAQAINKINNLYNIK